MTIILDGTTGITTPGLINTGSETVVNLTTSGNTTLGDATTDTLNVGAGGLVKDASGNVGIGTASPAQKLHVASAGTVAIQVQNTASSGGSYFKSTNTATTCNFGVDAIGGYIETLGAYATVFYTNSAQRMIIDSSGNVGIGTSTPNLLGASKNLLVEATSGNDAIIAAREPSTDTHISLYQQAGASYIIAGKSSGTPTQPLITYVGGAERTRIDSGGRFLINNTSGIWNTSERLAVLGTNGDAIASFKAGSTGIGQLIFVNNTGGLAGYINFSGTSTSYLTSSDYRLKENIAPMTGALAKVSALKPCTYTWKESGEASQGFIAHELQEVCPDAVVGEKDFVDAEGNPKYQGIDTSFLVATLTAAIQEQQAIINDLTTRLTALENK
jgi:hypothetical protein